MPLDAAKAAVLGYTESCFGTYVPQFNGQATAKAHGAHDYPFALVPHPMASAAPAELSRQAKVVLPAVLRLLLSG